MADHDASARIEHRFAAGDAVQTPFGTGVVREARRTGQYVVDVGSRSIVCKGLELSAAQARPKHRREQRETLETLPSARPAVGSSSEVDLHGMSVADALARTDEALNQALLAGHAELRVVHGRGSGRIRAAIHAHLAGLPGVRAYRLDSRNAGVTIVAL